MEPNSRYAVGKYLQGEMSLHQDILNIAPQTPDELLAFTKDSYTLNQHFMILLRQCVTLTYKGDYSAAMSKTKPLLDYIWEKLNTGYWKDVDVTWRFCYTVVSVLKCISQAALMNNKEHQPCSIQYEEIIKTCDMGLLMGAPLFDNILSKISILVHKYHQLERTDTSMSKTSSDVTCKRILEDSGEETVPSKYSKVEFDSVSDMPIDKDKEIQRVECPSLQKFKSLYMDQHIPVILTGMMDYWPARSSRPWSIERIRQVAGVRTVPIEIGSKYTEDSWTQTLMTVNDFIDKFILQSDDVGYLAQHQLFDQIPELRDDIVIPDYCFVESDNDVDINAWFGPKGTVSPLHYDPKHNLLAQVMGAKYIRLYSDSVSDMVYPHDDMLLCNTSKVDVENPDTTQFPKFKHAPYTECVLGSGEMLYIPPKYWHFVKSLSVSFSASFWFH